MRFTVSNVSAVLAMVSSAVAQVPDFDAIYTPTAGQHVVAGSTIPITWEVPANPAYASGTVTISLIGGQTQGTQVELATIATGVANSAGTFQWTVDASLGGLPFYGLVFTLEGNADTYQYSNPFIIDAIAASQSSAAPTVVPTVTPTASVGNTKTVSLSIASPTATSSSASAAQSSAAPTASSAAPPASETTVTRDMTTTVSCTTSSTTMATSTRAAPTPAVAVPSVPAPAAGEASSAPSPAPAVPEANGSGAAPTKTITSTSWTAPSNPPVPTTNPSSITTSGAARAGSSLAAIGGLIVAFFAL